MTENDLIKKLKKGDHHAFETLVNDQKNKVINVCHGFVHNREDAEDITQEVFLEVYRSIKGFRESSNISTWIYRIAVAKSLDFLKAKKRKKRFAGLLRIFSEQEEIEQKAISAKPLRPDEATESMERKQILMKAIDKLGINQQKAFVLSQLKGFSNKEIAGIMGTSVSAVEAYLNRARQNLRMYLHSYYKGEL